MKIAVVGGNWDESGGRSSSYIAQLAQAMGQAGVQVQLFNGGEFAMLASLLEGRSLANCNAVLWAANVPNELPKQRSVKDYYPHMLLVSTKRNNDEYSFQELVNRALGLHANLGIDFRRDDNGMVCGRVYDPLGAVWQDYTSEVPVLAAAIVSRLAALAQFTRQPAVQKESVALTVPNEAEFFELVRTWAEKFHDLIQPADGVTRFLGNSSFRCARGFPSLRQEGTGQIFVSRRNVDKRFIGPEAFVGVKLDGERVSYWGPHKPSVDTPIQLRLYDALPNIRFMIHGHVYVAGAPTTRRAVPCGAVEEVKEIIDLVPNQSTKYAVVNLLGHGFLGMADRPENLQSLEFISRPVPERLDPDKH